MENGGENVIFPLFGWNEKEDERKACNFFFFKLKRKEERNGIKKKSKNQLHFFVTLLLTHNSNLLSIIAYLLTKAISILEANDVVF